MNTQQRNQHDHGPTTSRECNQYSNSANIDQSSENHRIPSSMKTIDHQQLDQQVPTPQIPHRTTRAFPNRSKTTLSSSRASTHIAKPSRLKMLQTLASLHLPGAKVSQRVKALSNRLSVAKRKRCSKRHVKRLRVKGSRVSVSKRLNAF